MDIYNEDQSMRLHVCRANIVPFDTDVHEINSLRGDTCVLQGDLEAPLLGLVSPEH